MQSSKPMKRSATWLPILWGCAAWLHAANAATLHIEPSNVTLAVGERKLVQVVAAAPAPTNASDPVGLAAFQFTAEFEAVVVDVGNPNEAFRPNILPYAPLGGNPFCTFVRGTATCTDPPWFLTSTGRAATGRDESGAGRVQVAYGTSGTPAPPTGTGVIALLELVGQGNGCTTIRLTDVILADNSGVPRKYDTTVQGAQVCVGAFTCTPGTEQACYEGPDGTDGVGVCHAGVQQCLPDGSGFGPCQGQTLPSAEVCNAKDDNCDGQTDEELGTLTCGIGACERTVLACEAGVSQVCVPGLPGTEGPATDLTCSNGSDDDCDGATDAADSDCDQSPLELIPGGGSGKTDCLMEWFVENPHNPLDKKGFPNVKQSCVDGDPTCDADEISGQCTFLVTTCLNVDDDRLVDRKGVRVCFPSDVAEVEVDKARDMEPAFVALGGDAAGLCSKGKKGELCDANIDCDTEPGAGDGKCKGRFVFFTPPLTGQQCTEALRFVVSLKETPRGLKKASSALQAEAVTSIPTGGRKGLADLDSLNFTCLPKTAE